VACEGGQVVGDHAQGAAWTVRGLDRTPLAVGEPVPTVREALRAFVRLILDGEQPPVTVEDGADAVLIAEACLRSAATGTAVPVGHCPRAV
jgi:predicted dehydrogenase